MSNSTGELRPRGLGAAAPTDESPEPPPVPLPRALLALAQCSWQTAVLLRRGRIRQPGSSVGRRIYFADGSNSVVYRETVIDGPAPELPAVLVVGFRLRHVRSRWAHALFRWESELNTILFAGFSGLVSKLWLRHDERDLYRGFYQWDNPELAVAYVGALRWVLALVSEPGSIQYAVLPGLDRDEVLADPAVIDDRVNVAPQGWWRPEKRNSTTHDRPNGESARSEGPGGGASLFQRLTREVAAAGLASGPDTPDPVSDAEVDDLPEAVQRYLRFMGVVGAPRHWSFTARFQGQFRLRPGQGWMPAEAWQYNSAVGVARIFVLRIRFAGFVPMTGVDSYVRGRGRMRGKLLNIVTVADGQGDEFDIGELTTYLNDAVLLAPSLLLRPGTEWRQQPNESAFEVTLTDRGHRVTGRVTIDEQGAPIDFATTDRFADLPGGLRRTEWHTPISRWGHFDGRPIPASVSAFWRLPEGDLRYIDGRIDDICFDRAPIATPRADRRRAPRRAGLGAAQIVAALPAAPLARRWHNGAAGTPVVRASGGNRRRG